MAGMFLQPHTALPSVKALNQLVDHFIEFARNGIEVFTGRGLTLLCVLLGLTIIVDCPLGSFAAPHANEQVEIVATGAANRNPRRIEFCPQTRNDTVSNFVEFTPPVPAQSEPMGQPSDKPTANEGGEERDNTTQMGEQFPWGILFHCFAFLLGFLLADPIFRSDVIHAVNDAWGRIRARLMHRSTR